MKKTKADTLVVGAGPTGLTLACELLRRGVPCRIIDKHAAPSNHSKALGVSATSLMIFERLNIAEKLIKAGIKMQDTLFYWQGKRFLHTNYRYLKNTKYPFMLLAHQTETEKYLNECLESLGGKVERGVALENLSQDKNQVSVILTHADGQKEYSHFSEVIGCDGSQSKVRELLGVNFIGKDYGLHFIYGDVELQNWHADPTIAHYYLNGSNLLIVIPTITGAYRVVGLIPGDKTTRPKTTLEDLQNYMDTFGPEGIILKNPTQFGSVPIYYRLADKNRVGRVYLAGDAYHLFSPIGGQGMNTGIQEAYNLAWKLAYVKKGRAKYNLLDTYETERLPLVTNLIGDVEKTIQFLIRPDKENDSLTSNIVPQFKNRNNFRNVLPKNYSGFNYKYPPSHFTKNNIAQYICNYTPNAGEYTNDFDALHSATELTLICSLNTANPNKKFYTNKINQLLEQYPFIHFKYQQAEHIEKFCLIKPDGYIAYQDLITNLDDFSAYLDQFYLSEVVYG